MFICIGGVFLKIRSAIGIHINQWGKGKKCGFLFLLTSKRICARVYLHTIHKDSSMQKFIDHMIANGCEPANHSDIVPDDKRHLIQLAGDSRLRKRLYYRVAVDGDFTYGWYRHCGIGQTFNYHDGKGSTLNRDEILAIKRARADSEKLEREIEAARVDRLSRRLSKVVSRMPKAETHPYLARKKVGPHGARLRAKTGELVIPAYGPKGAVYSVQKISDKAKLYYKGGPIKGCYYPLANKDDDLSRIILCEGFSTGASVREATGMPVVVCFDAGNLVSVAKVMREKYPSASFIIASDHDQWKFNPKKRPVGLKSDDIPGDDPKWDELREGGFTYNTGLDKARQAAVALGGAHVITPPFASNDARKLTDFNDYALAYGLDAVKELFDIPAAMQEEAPDSIPYESYDMGVQAVGGEPAQESRDVGGDFGMNFRVLGYNGDAFYYYPFDAKQIVKLSAAGHSINNLLQIETLSAWESRFGYEKCPVGKVALMASNAMMQMARTRGVFKEEDKVRGCGAWLDRGRLILNCGDALYINDERKSFRDIDSDFTYVASSRMLVPSATPLKNSEAHDLREICESVTWENKLSGSLLAGWLVVAPICPALDYRPHIYITGEAESGKSTVYNKIIKPVIGDIGMYFDGGSTEAAIRQTMGYDGRPLIYDEGENTQSMEGVIGLARKASTGSVIKKFGQPVFKAQFAACFSAINPPVNKTADESRISFMNIKKNRRPNALDEYEQLLDKIDATITEDYGKRLLARTVGNIENLNRNIATFQKAFRLVTGGARASQQIGTMLAGLYLLSRTDVITLEMAQEWVKRYEWNDHTMLDQESDPMRLVQHIAGSIIRMSGGQERSVGEMISMVYTDRDGQSDKTLRQVGISVKDGRVSIANRSSNLARLLKDTEWSARWGRTLGDINGAEKEKSVYFVPGFKTSATSLPISMFMDESADD